MRQFVLRRKMHSLTFAGCVGRRWWQAISFVRIAGKRSNDFNYHSCMLSRNPFLPIVDAPINPDFDKINLKRMVGMGLTKKNKSSGGAITTFFLKKLKR